MVMPLFNLMEFWSALPARGRLLGLDPGRMRIGVALSDVNRRLASPYGVILRGKMKQNAAEVIEIAAREGIAGLVVGMPLSDDQAIGRAAQAARDWAHGMSAATGLPAMMQDETLTTAEAHERMIGADMTRAARGRVIDKVAAAAILQAALDDWHKKSGGG